MCPKVRFGHRTATGGPGKVAVRKPPETKIPAPLGRTNRIFSYLWGRNDPFISRKVLQSHMQFGFGTSAFFPIFVLQSAAAGCLGSTEKSGKFILAAKRISCFAVRPAPYGTGYGFLRHYGAGYMCLLLSRFTRTPCGISNSSPRSYFMLRARHGRFPKSTAS